MNRKVFEQIVACNWSPLEAMYLHKTKYVLGRKYPTKVCIVEEVTITCENIETKLEPLKNKVRLGSPWPSQGLRL